MENIIYKGTELKLNINIEPIGEVTMDDYDFTCEFYTSPKAVITIEKNKMIKVDDSNYIALLDSQNVMTGKLKCKITAYIPDADFPDMLRTEVVTIDTGMNITRTI